MVPTEGVEPTHSYEYQILSLARLPIPPRRHSYFRNLATQKRPPHPSGAPTIFRTQPAVNREDSKDSDRPTLFHIKRALHVPDQHAHEGIAFVGGGVDAL